MKKITFLLSCFVLFSAFTCDNESLDSDLNSSLPNTSSAALIGDWDLTEFNGTISSETNLDGEIIQSLIELEGTNFDYGITFDGSNYFGEGGYDLITTYTVDGQSAGSTTVPYENTISEGTYSVSGNIMTIDGNLIELDGVEMDSTGPQEIEFILSNNGNTLTFTQVLQVNQSVGGGVTMTTNIEVTSVFERL